MGVGWSGWWGECRCRDLCGGISKMLGLLQGLKVLHLIHWGSSVTVSPGVMMDLWESLGRLEGRTMSVSPSESIDEVSEASSWVVGGAGRAAVIVKVIVEAIIVRNCDGHLHLQFASSGV